ncbi:hypothetical protein MADA3029_1100073 [Vibrio nigripulchritudo MADA3029]|nr:hypothetical protein VIBNIMADA3020_730074 [Vibrio nigripulchritudo MADA3020]CCN51574.1 hypothetical protein VIBNIMADA3021_1130024 [Vibrio nigripulchritudo MADA3021]CCN57372.1 hypothetical protein MADA3029_1100073 [Vibrio nigripulchritudo MADA3029]
MKDLTVRQEYLHALSQGLLIHYSDRGLNTVRVNTKGCIYSFKRSI